MIRCAWLLIALAVPAQAAELNSVQVEHDKGVYSMSSEVWFDAPVEQVFEVFRRWDYSEQFSGAIVESRDIEADEQGRPGFYIRYKGCVLFFCKSFVRAGYVENETNVVLRAFADPERSDFHFSNEVWSFQERDGGTAVLYDLQMSPKFWIPPGIGPRLLKRKLKKGSDHAIDRIEALAQGLGDE